MKSYELKQAFLDYFRKQGHTVVPSDALIPSGDPTLLFTSAGMVQFKRHFLGQVKLDYKRAVSCQKCLRTSDIDQIGKTSRHLSFFEMLGNFSFGDYFKEDAIKWSWEFLTKEAGLDKSRLFVTIFNDDNEAFEIWKELIDVSRIYRLGEDTNFWNMGPTGPCGPCSELLYDMGKKYSCGKKNCGPECDCDRYLEVWNLVFTQFDRQEDGRLLPLPKKNIDTGMGFERLLCAHQGVASPFETDLFVPVISRIKEVLDIGLAGDDERNLPVLRLIADHIRALVFMASDGILPSNEGRGYIFRRLLRRAAREGRLLGAKEPFLHSLIPDVINVMKQTYGDLTGRRENITSIIKTEEKNFLVTLGSGLKRINELIVDVKKKKSKVFPAEEAFKLFDTYGFPVEITREIAREKGLGIDMKRFNRLVEDSRKTAKKSWKGSGEKDMALYSEVLKKSGSSDFTGYDEFEGVAAVKALIVDGNPVKTLKEGARGEVILDKTPFYPESGGQAGDTGALTGAGAAVEVTNTIKPLEGVISHIVRVTRGGFSVGDKVTAKVDVELRRSTMGHHTATHLLHKALREVLGRHVTQAGSLVLPNRLRFDYTHMKAPTPEELDVVEETVNKAITGSIPVNVVETTQEAARSYGAMALFGEKYGSKVRCVVVGDASPRKIKDAYSLELCGGTHVKNTADIGVFKILSDTSISSGVRRIEAISGTEVLKHSKGLEMKIEEWAHKLKAKPGEIDTRLTKVLQRVKNLEKENEALKSRLISGNTADSAEEKMIDAGGKRMYVDFIDDVDMKTMRNQSDVIISQKKPHVCVLANATSFVVNISPEGEKMDIDASSLAKGFAKEVNGKAGGRSNFAQGGGKISPESLKTWFKNILK